MYMNEWDEKREDASRYLEEAEKAFRNGDEITGCIAQRKAGEVGIDATKSLINAMKANGSTDGIENLNSGLLKWQELKDYC